MEQSQTDKPSSKALVKEKAMSYYGCVREKAPVYWQVARAKAVETWNSGVKGKAICVGAVVGVLLLGWLVFGGKSNDVKAGESIAKTQTEPLRVVVDSPVEAETVRRRPPDDRTGEAEQPIVEQNEQAVVQRQAREDAGASGDATESIADLEIAARTAMSGVEIWGEIFEYASETKVPYAKFAEVYYTIEDAFIPAFAEPLLTLQSGQPIFFAGYAKKFADELIPRADHLLYYCCRTGLNADATAKDWENYVRLLVMAQMEKRMILAYAIAFGQDSAEMLDAANELFKEFTTLRKTLPPHNPPTDAAVREKKYAALPSPARPIDLNDAAGSVFNDCHGYFMCLNTFWPQEENESQEDKDERAKKRLAFAKRKWVPIDVGNFTVKTFCGLEFGQTLAACEKVLGNAIGPAYYVYDNHAYNSAVYQLKKPFRKFTRAFLKFGCEREENEKLPGGRIVEGLRAVRLEADIPADVNYESCLEELAKVKKLLEDKYQLNIGKGQAGEPHLGRSYWYGVGLSGKGRIVLGILPARKKFELPKTGNVSYEDAEKAANGVTDGSMTMVLEVQYADVDEMEKKADDTRKQLDAKRSAEAESKKAKLNVSDSEGADVL